MVEQNAVKLYLEFIKFTESPPLMHKWAFLSCAAAALGRDVYFKFGHLGNIYPNMYVLLTGVPATRKSSAITVAEELLSKSGFKHFGYSRSTREKFLEDFEMGFNSDFINSEGEFDISAAIKAEGSGSTGHQAYICSDEFVDFLGRGNMSFIDTLTTLYDTKEKDYTDRLKNSRSIRIPKPVVNILGGITPSSFASAMPSDVAGQGFLSRLLLIFANPSSRKITIPPPPDAKIELELIRRLTHVMQITGEMRIGDESYKLLDEIYQNYNDLSDPRLAYYCARRLTHLIKLSMVCQALQPDCPKDSPELTTEAIIEANTYLHEAEMHMHHALGEYSDSRFAKASSKLLTFMINHKSPVGVPQIWEVVSNDLDRPAQMNELITTLVEHKKIKKVEIGSSLAYFQAVQVEVDKNLIGTNFPKYAPNALSKKADKVDLVGDLKDVLDREVKIVAKNAAFLANKI